MATTTTLPKLPGLHDCDLIKLLGEGGMGKVYLARDRRTDETVVVKTIHAHLLHEAKTRQRFHQETDLMRRFSHPNAVAFLRASPPSVEPPFIIMEYVRGITLDDLMKTYERLPPLRVGKLLAQLCLFLHTAHANGLLHRDLTPANIMIVNEGTPHETIKVMDFGLARRIGFYIPSGQLDSLSSTIDGGTPDYICPEQIEGKQVDHRGDLYSVGVLLYGLLTGHVPFEHLTQPDEILLAQLKQQPPRFSHWHVTNLPSGVERVVLSCLCKSPGDRPESARALIELFQLALGCRLVDDKAFESSEDVTRSTLLQRKAVDPRNVLDRFEASMVEQTVAIKLRGFVDGVGGQVVESDAGVIKVKLPLRKEVATKRSGVMGWFGPKVEEHIEWLALELHMARKQAGTRNLVAITVVWPKPHQPEHKPFCERVCRELRAYLMVGH
jgi:serine/threonine-protein kinase